VNPSALASVPKGIVANPNCTTMQIMLPLQALHRAFGLTGFTATSFQAAGGAGQKGMDELAAQVGPLTAAGDLLRTDGARAMTLVQPRVHARALAYNVVPILGTEDDHGYTDEEYKLLHESRKILGLPELEVSPTCTRVPVMVGHCVQLAARFAEAPRVSEAVSHLSRFPGLEVAHLPTPLDAAGRDEVLVGRVRADLFDPHVLHLWVVGDNLLKGAALNTVQIAELLLERGAVG
jgi:aspartate-semialdehyde dehydrogenase